MKIVIIGGGIIGTAHAFEALKAGHEVIQLERDEVARSASVRNFGLVWVSGRKSGAPIGRQDYNAGLSPYSVVCGCVICTRHVEVGQTHACCLDQG